MNHHLSPPQTAWQRQREREEDFLRAATLLRARRKSHALAAMGILAAACVMVGGAHLAHGMETNAQPPANTIDCLPTAGWQISAVQEGGHDDS